MIQTHSRDDFGCVTCGTEVSFRIDPQGTWDYRVTQKLRILKRRKTEWDAIRGVCYFVMFCCGVPATIAYESNDSFVNKFLLDLAFDQVHNT